MSVKRLVWSAQLRAHGLNGFGGEEGIMAYALNTHFQCKGPEDWHFASKRDRNRKNKFFKCAAQLRNEVRLLSKPKWIQTYFNDLITIGEQKLCKTVPRPERAVLSSETMKASRWQQLGTYGKRQKICQEAEDQYNPKRMNDQLFTQLKITTLSLPSCLRPGKNPR